MDILLSNTELDILKALAFIIDLEEDGKLNHSWRVAAIAKILAEEKCKQSTLTLYIAGLLHDIGTFDISHRLSHHEGHLENKDISAIKTHPQKGAAIVASIPHFLPIAKIIFNHHEWINGKGYPRGLTKNEISLESQILRIADKMAFAIETKQPKKPSELHKTLKERVGKEFPKDFYDYLMAQFQNPKIWESLTNNKTLANYTEKIFDSLPINKHAHNLSSSKDLFHLFGRILDAKHAYTEGHSRRVSYFSVLLALALGLPDSQIEKIEVAAFLHDIGKIAIPKSILDKTSQLTANEYEIIKTHASLSYEIIKNISAFNNLSNIVSADQEHWDGSGYPEGLKTNEIPIESRIIFIADAFDAMTSNRSYHQAMPVNEAIKELKESSGKDFDPDLVNIACKIFEGFQNSAVLSCYYNAAH